MAPGKSRKAAGGPQEARETAYADRGAPGPAAQARPRIMVQTATGERGIGRERAEAVRVLDGHVIDRLHRAAQIGDRQHEAAVILWRLAVAAGLIRSRVPAYGGLRGAPQPASHAADTQPGPEDLYHRALRRLSQAHQAAIRAMLADEHPGVSRLATLQSALDALADVLRVDKAFVWADPEWEEN